MGFKTFENEIFLEIFYINLDIIIKKKFKILKDFFEKFCDNISKNIPPIVVC
jgi:hypothetical protein